MPKLEQIVLINAANFDYVEFPVGGHTQVFGVNGHGKSTLLRTVLFFYLGTNDKAPYALHDTKTDFVSHYLGSSPSYLIYEVSRGEPEPRWHVAVTRPPGGRVQFVFVDAPYRRDYYIDSHMVLPIEAVQDRLRAAQCASSVVGSYDEFKNRIYGVTRSPFAVFRPAPRTSGQVGILPRIISGIFTVNQLNADKLKSALTCGVSNDALTTELDLHMLKHRLERFRRVHEAVKTYLRHDQDANELVALADQLDGLRADRRRAIESLVRMSRLLPAEATRIEHEFSQLQTDRTRAQTAYEQEDSRLQTLLQECTSRLAVLDDKIAEGVRVEAEYATRRIEEKALDLQRLPALLEQARVAAAELQTLTAAFADENERREKLVADLDASWSIQSGEFERQRTACETSARAALEALVQENTDTLAALNEEQRQHGNALAPLRRDLDADLATLRTDTLAHSQTQPPRELIDTRAKLRNTEKKLSEQKLRQETLRSRIALDQKTAEHAREKLEREATDERVAAQAAIAALTTQRDEAATELEAFDASLVRFFQTEVPATWPHAAKTLNRATLFHPAADLRATAEPSPAGTAWGVAIDTTSLPEAEASYDRAALDARLLDLRRNLTSATDQLTAAGQRYIVAIDEHEKSTAQARHLLEAELSASKAERQTFLDDQERLDNHAISLQSQFDQAQKSVRDALERRNAELQSRENALRADIAGIDSRFEERRLQAAKHFTTRRSELQTVSQSERARLDREQVEALAHRKAETTRIDTLFREALAAKGIDPALIQSTQTRVQLANEENERISTTREEVAEYQGKKRTFIDPLPGLRTQRQSADESHQGHQHARDRHAERHQQACTAFDERQKTLDLATDALKQAQQNLHRFRDDPRFAAEQGLFDREDLPAAALYHPGALGEHFHAAQTAHEQASAIHKHGNDAARRFLNRFEPEALDKAILGFSAIHEHFDWFIFVGHELRPFVENRGISAMTQLQTHEFEQLIRHICARNADFREGFRQVKQTAELVEARLRENNFVDVLDSVELKIDHVDSPLTKVLDSIETFADITFSGPGASLFERGAQRTEIDRAIDTFSRLLREIDHHSTSRLSLTDTFDFQIRIRENGHDMGWRRSLDDIGSTGTDYLVKMLIYLALIEVYRERAIDPTHDSTVHCVLDETGVLAARYVRSVLDYASARGILLITAGHSQQTLGFQHWVRVRKVGSRFAGQMILRRLLRCD